MRTLSKWKYRK